MISTKTRAKTAKVTYDLSTQALRSPENNASSNSAHAHHNVSNVNSNSVQQRRNVRDQKSNVQSLNHTNSSQEFFDPLSNLNSNNNNNNNNFCNASEELLPDILPLQDTPNKVLRNPKLSTYIIGAKILNGFKEICLMGVALRFVVEKVTGSVQVVGARPFITLVGRTALSNKVIKQIYAFTNRANLLGFTAVVVPISRYLATSNMPSAEKIMWMQASMTVFIAPIVEELIFRGTTAVFRQQLHKLVDRYCTTDSGKISIKRISSIILYLTQAVIFGLGHAHMGGNYPEAGVYVIFSFVAGLVLGAVEERYGILSAVAVHSIHNGLVCLESLQQPVGGKNPTRKKIISSSKRHNRPDSHGHVHANTTRKSVIYSK